MVDSDVPNLTEKAEPLQTGAAERQSATAKTCRDRADARFLHAAGGTACTTANTAKPPRGTLPRSGIIRGEFMR